MDMNYWMGIALEKAKESFNAGEVPVGCLFIYNNEIIATASNTVNETRNATRHAEMNCIDIVVEFCKEKNLDYKKVFENIDVVVTVEPCIMCASALYELNIQSIVFGCNNDRFGGCGSVFDVSKVYKTSVKIEKNVRGEEGMQLLKEFYKGENPNAPESKRKGKKKEMKNDS